MLEVRTFLNSPKQGRRQVLYNIEAEWDGDGEGPGGPSPQKIEMLHWKWCMLGRFKMKFIHRRKYRFLTYRSRYNLRDLIKKYLS